MLKLVLFLTIFSGLSAHASMTKHKSRILMSYASNATEAEFNHIVDSITDTYKPILESQGISIELTKLWSSDVPVANAGRFASGRAILRVSGGMMRQPMMTRDGFALVVCHETGHTFGFNEGESDYFATSKCLRTIWENEDNAGAIAGNIIPPAVLRSCSENFESPGEINLCIRINLAAQSTSRYISLVDGSAEASFDEADDTEVSSTNPNHAKVQCRLDTFLAGSICEAPASVMLVWKNEFTGACHPASGHDAGLRPLCWFNPSSGLNRQQKISTVQSLVRLHQARTIKRYSDDIRLTFSAGKILQLLGGWDNKNKIVVNVYEGAVTTFTRDELALSTCHELGHILGDVSFKTLGMTLRAELNPLNNVEGEADYFGGNCFRDYLKKKNPGLFEESLFEKINSIAVSAYQKMYNRPLTLEDYFPTPYKGVNISYPEAECRLLSIMSGAYAGARPQCWYNP